MCAGGGLDVLDMTSNPEVLMRMFGGSATGTDRFRLHARDLPDTPPVDVSFEAGLLAHGSKHPAQPSRNLMLQ